MILISFVSLMVLLALHEASHFLVAKAFGIGVREFGIGYPPRLLGKKIKGTLYSINLIPFGAFVDIPAENMRKRGFWQRFSVLGAGVFSFFVFAFVLTVVILIMGAPTQISDEAEGFPGAYVQILDVAKDSPAEKAGLEAGDVIKGFSKEENVSKTEEVQSFVKAHRGEEIEINIERGGYEFSIRAVPRVDPPQHEGALGIALGRIAIQERGFLDAVVQAFRTTTDLTIIIARALSNAVTALFSGKETGVKLIGPVGIMDTFVKTGKLGAVYFLNTMAVITLHLAIFNALPFIPVLDGGKIFLLGVEKALKKSFNRKIEDRINKFFFGLLLLLMLFVTIKDIKSLL